MSLFFMNCERAVLFSIKRDLDTPPHPLYHPQYSVCVQFIMDVILIDFVVKGYHECGVTVSSFL